MRLRILFIFCVLATLLAAPPDASAGGEAEQGTIVTLWPFFDYRESPGNGFSNLSILGPLIKVQQQGEERTTAVRPFVYRTVDEREQSATTSYLYPLASSREAPDVSTFQVLQLFQVNTFRKDEPDKVKSDSMLFPFYIRGKSETYGPYTSVFPFYGTLYERLWRDEIHYTLFPLYSRTVKKGTTTRNYLYPFFSTTSGVGESGFQFWPLYGSAAKEGSYERRFVLWPFYFQERKGLDTDNPTERLTVFPLYSATESPRLSSRTYLWPFMGWTSDREAKQEERRYLWPLVMTATGEKRDVKRYLPFYAEERSKETLKRWYLWPLYRHDELASDTYCRDRDRILFFLYSDLREQWPVDHAERRRTTFWPLFVFNRDTHGVKQFSFPALMEPILPQEGIEQSWAPLWRVYIQRWSDSGDSTVSFLWNLYWHERRGDDLAYELFPLVSYRSEGARADVSVLKGLIRLRQHQGVKTLSLFWLPFGITWDASGKAAAGQESTMTNSARLEP
ncbi:hypothetical protein KI811_13750 [Geobacter hydrogenophilus]|uniref:Uncharacterized protein n=1 Tax=Geobacter hydrogenophilus TaxID=40983 RepID=A0A9W6LBP4_9BACT|nr:hypothetical protein [Geobacter hydrogenophilus]MBT0894874.1 hypothetical protein [Geobacter hydrogenophilus]GLI36721.1 hypothetical protein GHYDROH2_02220 [Geobacter hydrogenophilus]